MKIHCVRLGRRVWGAAYKKDVYGVRYWWLDAGWYRLCLIAGVTR